MNRYRSVLQTVVAKEAKAYGFTIVVWSAGALLITERGKPTPSAVLAFAGGIMLAQAIVLLAAYGSPTNVWTSRQHPEYVWSAFHALPVAAGVLLGWLLAAATSGLWAYLLAPLCAVLAYELLLGLESMLLSAPQSASRSDRSL